MKRSLSASVVDSAFIHLFIQAKMDDIWSTTTAILHVHHQIASIHKLSNFFDTLHVVFIFLLCPHD